MQTSFPEEHRCALTCLSEALKGTINSKLCEPIVDTLTLQNPKLAEVYPEVAVLLLSFHIRKTSRSLAVAMSSLTGPDALEAVTRNVGLLMRFFQSLAELLPDLCFVVISQMCGTLLETLQGEDASAAQTSLVAVGALSQQAAEVSLQVSTEMLRATSSLTHRCESLSLYFRDVFPFCKVE